MKQNLETLVSWSLLYKSISIFEKNSLIWPAQRLMRPENTYETKFAKLKNLACRNVWCCSLIERCSHWWIINVKWIKNEFQIVKLDLLSINLHYTNLDAIFFQQSLLEWQSHMLVVWGWWRWGSRGSSPLSSWSFQFFDQVRLFLLHNMHWLTQIHLLW